MQGDSVENPDVRILPSSSRPLWKDWIFWIQFIGVMLLTWLAYWLVYRLGVAHDCAALGVKQDGQCGLASAMGAMFGVLVGLSVLVVGSGVTVFLRYKRNRKLEETPS